jgi:tight adherence protein B
VPTSVYTLSLLLAAVLGLLTFLGLIREWWQGDQARVQERIDNQLLDRSRVRARNGIVRTLSPREMQRIVSRQESPWWGPERLTLLIEQAGLTYSSTQVLLCSLGSFAVVAIPGMAFLPRIWHGLVLGTAAGAVPFLWLLRKRRLRENLLRLQLGDVFELMSSTLRAGQSITDSMQAVSSDFPAPISEEFFICAEQQNLGLDPEIALRQLAARNRIAEIKTFVVAMLVHRQSGGNLSEILQTLSRLVRDRQQLLGEIDSLTAEARLQAWILMALPPFLLGVMVVLNREYAKDLFDRPELLQLMGLGMLAGWLCIRKIIQFDS